jgi:microcystin-dependent protein
MSYNPSSSLSGEVRMFAGSSAPSGWLLCQGQAISRTVYADLFSLIGTTYGSGDGSTTFNIPDTRGIFVRGVGSQTVGAVTYTGTIGTKQNDQMQGHTHAVPGATVGTGLGAFFRGSSPEYSNGSTQGPLNDGSNGNPRTGGQTHPANISFNYIIKV